jgi:hypothetical protein
VRAVFVLVNGGEAEGFEPPVPFGTLAFKSQGNHVPGYVPGCRPAGFRAIRLAPCGADSSRLLHRCYTPTSSPSVLRRRPKRGHGGPPRGRWRPAKAPVDRLAMGPGAVLTEPV